MNQPVLERPTLAEPLSRMGEVDALDAAFGREVAIAPGQTVIMAKGREIVARKDAPPRQLGRIMADLKVYCAQFGETYYYSWEVKDRKNDRKALVEGGTIKLANDLVNLYGNCAYDCDISENATHYIFKAWFLDYERGVAASRLFQQRKSQNTGMRDVDRQADIIFQIGQSKAIRNVVLNALSSLANFALEESKRALTEKFKDPTNARKAHAFVDRVMAEHRLDIKRVEAVVGRVREEWTVQNLARVYSEMVGIHDGMANAEEVYPSAEDAERVTAEKKAKDAEGRKRTPKDKDETKNETGAASKPPETAPQAEASSNPPPGASAASSTHPNDNPDDPNYIPPSLRRTEGAKPATETKPAAASKDEPLFGDV